MRTIAILLVVLVAATRAGAGVGDVQIMTDHPWYGGELSCSTFERLFATQAALYKRVTGRGVDSDEDKAIAAWFWRNVNHFHCTAAGGDFWGTGFAKPGHLYTHEFWRGQFAFGFSLCYATHAQWCAEINRLLGPGRSRKADIEGHSPFEVYLTGGAYGDGRWALLDHDISTIMFDGKGKRLLSMTEVIKGLKDGSVPRNIPAEKNHGWIAPGLHRNDIGYNVFLKAFYNDGYATVPPMVHLRAGESVRKYLKPGLDDGKTFVYWGINYNRPGNIIGPTRGRTWVNMPEKMYKAKRDCGWRAGQARFANAVYTYRPDFASGGYAEGVIDRADDHVTFEFYTPYIVAATPPPAAAAKEWGIYEPGCTGGLAITGGAGTVSVSTDQGATWSKPAELGGAKGVDLTDLAKGQQQYWLKFAAAGEGAVVKQLAGKGLTIRTVCQAAPTMMPHLKGGRNTITCQASGLAQVSAGPYWGAAKAHVVAGGFGRKSVTMELAAPRKSPAVRLYAAAKLKYSAGARCAIDVSTDGGKTWKPVVRDWKLIRHEPEPADVSDECYLDGEAPLAGATGPVRVRFGSSGGEVKFLRAEAHLAYRVGKASPVTVTFSYKTGEKTRTASHTYRGLSGKPDTSWSFDAGPGPETVWVEYSVK